MFYLPQILTFKKPPKCIFGNITFLILNISFLKSVNQLVYVTDTEYVLCDEGTESLNVIKVAFRASK
jgi:hypothetical protein